MAKLKSKKSKVTTSPVWRRSHQKLNCDTCNAECTVGIDCVKVICWRCVAKTIDLPEGCLPDPKPNMPKGWRKKKQYIHEDGSVYEYGVENDALYGTILPKPKKEIVKVKSKKTNINKLPIQERSEARTQLLKELQFLKAEQARAINSSDSKRVSKKINQISKELLKIKY